MSLLGKLFAILNLAGLAGLLYMASLDYAKRRSWAYAVFREDLAIQGLPLDTAQEDTEGKPLHERIGEQTKKELFPQGKAVATQEEEVQHLQQEVNSLAGQPTAAGRKGLAFYATLLMPFAPTNSERERLRACRTYMADDKVADDLKPKFVAAWLEGQQEAQRVPKEKEPQPLPLRDAVIQALDLRQLEMARPFVDNVLAALPADPKNQTAEQIGQAYDQALAGLRTALANQLDGLFKEALKRGPKEEETASQTFRADLNRHQTVDERRPRIGRLLFNLYGSLDEVKGAQPRPENEKFEDNPNNRRFLTVVGLRQAIETVRDEAENLKALALEVESARGRDRNLFAVEHGKFLERVKERARDVETAAMDLARLRQLVTAHEEQLKKRRLDVKQYQDALAEARAATLKDLASLREKTNNLFNKRVEVRKKTDEIQTLEKDVRRLEDEVLPRR